jgi:sirohydrochlorin ferrochelatase
MTNLLRMLLPSWLWLLPGLVVGLSLLTCRMAFAQGSPSERPLDRQDPPGFLVIAPDRGFLGNREIKEAFVAFARANPARLVFISLSEDYDEAVKAKLQQALTDLRAEGATPAAVLPLILLEADPHLKKAKVLLDELHEQLAFAPPMSADYLTAQILEDRARALAKDSAHQRLVVVGYGATSTDEAQAMRTDLERLAAQVSLPFKERKVVLFFPRQAPDELFEHGNREAEERLRAAAGGAVVVPFQLGPKHTGSMQFTRQLEHILHGLPAAYDAREVLPHPNALLWLKKMANHHIKATREELGVVIMPHGAGEYLNEPILQIIEPLRQKYNLEVAFGMAEVDMLQEAIDQVERRGARRILVLRLYGISPSLKEETEYVLGLLPSPVASGHHGHHGGQARVRSGALLYTTGGFDGDPLIAEVLYERVMEISREPEQETVILLAHGAASDEHDRFWRQQMEKEAQHIRAKTPQFRAVFVATVREDWPEKRDQAVAAVRKLIAQANQAGNWVLVIANRLSGAGPYGKLLQGLSFELNGKGIAPHPNLTRWMDGAIESWIRSLEQEPSK